MMFKLIPDERKKNLEREYALRLGAVSLCSVIVILIIGNVGIFPTYLLSNIRNADVHDRLQKLEASPESEEDKVLREWYESLNRKLKYLSPNLDMDQPSAFIEESLQEKTEGIKITNLTFTNANNKTSLTLNGVASNRQVLTTFQNKLNATGRYGEVSLPVSNLAKDRNISFQLKLTPPKKK